MFHAITGIVVYAPALALSTVTGLSYLGSVLAVGCVCTFYSTLGGMKAVLVTDVFQSLLMFAAIFAVVIAGTLQVRVHCWPLFCLIDEIFLQNLPKKSKHIDKTE